MQRDHRDEIIDKLCDAVLGPDRYEWSSQYFFEDAVREVEERMAALEQPAQQQGWKLVPIDANDTMIDAFENFIGRDISGFRQAYQAMLNAAPQPAHQEPDLSWLKPETQKKIRQWLADGSFAERAIGVIDAQEKALMRYEAQQQEHEQQHTRDAETELNCAEEVLDGYAAHLEHQDTAFNRIGDYLKEVCEALKERPAQQEHLEHTSVRRSGPQM